MQVLVTGAAGFIDPISRDLGFTPKTPVEAGFPRFVEWFKAYHGLG